MLSDVLADAINEIEAYEKEDPERYRDLRLPIQIVKDAMFRLLAYLDDPAAESPKETWHYKHYNLGEEEVEHKISEIAEKKFNRPSFKPQIVVVPAKELAPERGADE
jgi:hypothetical protein